MADDESNTRVVTLEDTGWARLLFALLSQRFSGRAVLSQGEESRSIVFRGGFAVWTDFACPKTGFSEILASAGMFASEEAAALVDAAPEDSLDAFAKAVEDKAVDAETASMAMRDQCEQRLIATAGHRGELTLHDDPGVVEDVLTQLEPARTLRVINFGVRTFCSPEHADKSLEHLDDTDLVIGRAYSKYGERFGFDSGEQSTLRLLGGRASFRLGDLLEISGLDAVRGIQMLYTLWSCNMLVEAGSEPTAASEETSQGHSESSLVQELVVAKIDTGSPAYEVLALSKDATLADIDAAVEDLARKVAGVVTEATLEELRTGAYTQRQAAARTVARKALADRRWARAVETLRDLSALDPEDAPIQMDLAWAAWNEAERPAGSEARELDEAVTACAEGSDSVLARGQFYRGHVRKQQGRRKEALAAFERAADLDSRLLDAQREVRALSGSRNVSDKQPKSGASKKSKKTKAPAPSQKKNAGAQSKYWTGSWRYIWGFAGLLLTVMLAAQIILRLDRDF